MKRTGVLVFLATTVAVATASASTKTPAQYWSETGFSMAALAKMRILSNDNCTRDSVHLEACVEGLKALAVNAPTALTVIPDGMRSDPFYKKQKIVLRAYPLAIIEMPADDDSSSITIAYEKSALLRVNSRHWLETYLHSGAAAQIDFKTLLRQLSEISITDSSKEALIASEIYNTYITTAEDAHAHMNPVEEFKDQMNDSSTSFIGIGVSIAIFQGRVQVRFALKGGPAEKAGIKTNDQIIAVDGAPTKGMTPEHVVDVLRGPSGTTVQVRVKRRAQELTVAIRREQIVMPNVTTSLENNFGKKVGFISLRKFDGRACDDIAKGVHQLVDQQGAESLVLDFRGNPGGLLDQAVCIGGLFVGKKVIVIQKSLVDGTEEAKPAENDAITQVPLAVLIDAGSASASELVSGALQDHKRAWIIGDRSFGKGSVQESGYLRSNPKIFLFKTIARFYQPSGRTNERVGITPDLPVPLKPDATADETFALREADLYPIALAAVGPVWQQQRPKQVERLKSCVDLKSIAEIYKQKLANDENADYQALSAEKAVDCQIPQSDQ